MPGNHGYNLPTRGTEHWDRPLNANFERLDTDVEIRAPESERSTYTPKEGAKFLATDTGVCFIGDGATWQRIPSTGDRPRLAELRTPEFNNDQYVVNHSGETLSERLESALSALPNGQGTVYVTAHDEGRPWTWGTDLTLDPLEYNGIEIVVGHSVQIEYDGTGVPLTFDSNGQHQDDRHQIRLVGGEWIATDRADGWVRLRDIILAYIHPQQVNYGDVSNPDCFGVSVENHDLYSEASRISGDIEAPVGIQFVPASETGGSGTDSFHDTVIDKAHINASNVGVRLAGIFQFCELRKVALFGTEHGADLMWLDAPRMDGTVISATKWESPPNPGAITGIVTGPNYDGWYGPTIMGGYFGYGVTESHRDEGATKSTVMRIAAQEQGVTIEDVSSDARTHIDKRGNLSVSGDVSASAVEYEPVNVSDVRSPNRGTVVYHDGDGGTEGPAFYNGSSWVSLVDGSRLY